VSDRKITLYQDADNNVRLYWKIKKNGRIVRGGSKVINILKVEKLTKALAELVRKERGRAYLWTHGGVGWEVIIKEATPPGQLGVPSSLDLDLYDADRW